MNKKIMYDMRASKCRCLLEPSFLLSPKRAIATISVTITPAQGDDDNDGGDDCDGDDRAKLAALRPMLDSQAQVSSDASHC